MIGIYKITNLINNEFYIGQSLNINRRWAEHKSPKSNRIPIDKAIKQYGKENFKIEILEECLQEELSDRESYYIKKLKPHYNTICKDWKRTKEFCEKVSIATKKWWDNLLEETKQRIIKNNLKGPQKGHIVSEETREKLRNNPNCKHYKKVIIVELNKQFNSVNECAKYLKTDASYISNHFKGRFKTIKGFHISKV